MRLFRSLEKDKSSLTTTLKSPCAFYTKAMNAPFTHMAVLSPQPLTGQTKRYEPTKSNGEMVLIHPYPPPCKRVDRTYFGPPCVDVSP